MKQTFVNQQIHFSEWYNTTKRFVSRLEFDDFSPITSQKPGRTGGSQSTEVTRKHAPQAYKVCALCFHAPLTNIRTNEQGPASNAVSNFLDIPGFSHGCITGAGLCPESLLYSIIDFFIYLVCSRPSPSCRYANWHHVYYASICKKCLLRLIMWLWCC